MHRCFFHCGWEAQVREPVPWGSGREAAATPDAGFREITRAPAQAGCRKTYLNRASPIQPLSPGQIHFLRRRQIVRQVADLRWLEWRQA
jgi:hypothetical protein